MTGLLLELVVSTDSCLTGSAVNKLVDVAFADSEFAQCPFCAPDRATAVGETIPIQWELEEF